MRETIYFFSKMYQNDGNKDILTSYPSSLRNNLIRGGSIPKNLVSFFTLEGLESAGSSESLIRGCDCDRTIAMLVCVLRVAISHFMLSISCENLVVVESWKFQLVSHCNVFYNFLTCIIKCWVLISELRWATDLASVTTCDSSRWKRLLMLWHAKLFYIKDFRTTELL